MTYLSHSLSQLQGNCASWNFFFALWLPLSEATEAPKTTRVSRNLPKRFWQNLALIAVPAAVLVGVETYHATTILPELARSRAAVAHTFQVIDTARALDEAIQDAHRIPIIYEGRQRCPD